MMIKGVWVGTALLGALAIAPATAAPERGSANTRLNEVIKQAIYADGPLLLADERALIERKCGYAPGSWDGSNFSMNNGVLYCSNGKKVDDSEVRAMMDVAGPRISRRVNAAMKRPEVTAAIDAVAREASERALARLRERRR